VYEAFQISLDTIVPPATRPVNIGAWHLFKGFLRDVPVGGEELIFVSHPKYDLPHGIEEDSNGVKYRVNAGETEERLLVLQKRETPKNKEDK
jgi:hypothetical protein